jgi:tetratricopeptide (TPR) repeat protein
MSFAGREAAGNGDVSMWVTLLTKGDAIYLAESLSSFRQHAGQRQRQPEAIERGARGWDQLCADARRASLLPELSPGPPCGRLLLPKPWWPQEAAELWQALERGGPEDAAALARLTDLARLVPAEGALACACGSLLLQAGRTNEARRWMDRAVAATPWDPQCRRGLGIACLAVGDTGEALRQLGAAAEADPGDAVTRAALAHVARLAGATSDGPPLAGALDWPADGTAASDLLWVEGWILERAQIMDRPLELSIAVDDRPVAADPLRVPRQDVQAAHPLLAPYNPAPGFRIPLLVDRLAPGEHRLACTARCGPHEVRLGQARIEVRR